jgi:hypothetical protein
MLEAYLHFCANLILFTAGTAVLLFWIVVFVLLGIEIRDIVTEYYMGKKPEEEE